MEGIDDGEVDDKVIRKVEDDAHSLTPPIFNSFIPSSTICPFLLSLFFYLYFFSYCCIVYVHSFAILSLFLLFFFTL